MAIYPVPIKSFHEGDPTKLDHASFLIEEVFEHKCSRCGGEVTLENCWALHSLCYIGVDHIHCSGSCAYNLPMPESLLSEEKTTRELAEGLLEYWGDLFY